MFLECIIGLTYIYIYRYIILYKILYIYIYLIGFNYISLWDLRGRPSITAAWGVCTLSTKHDKTWSAWLFYDIMIFFVHLHAVQLDRLTYIPLYKVSNGVECFRPAGL